MYSLIVVRYNNTLELLISVFYRTYDTKVYHHRSELVTSDTSNIVPFKYSLLHFDDAQGNSNRSLILRM